jgi:hypothetical protein
MAALLAATPLAAIYIGEALSVDSCLDGGGSYDYALGACDYRVNHPYVSFAERHPKLLMASPIANVLAGTLTAIFATALSSRRLTSR